MTATNATTEVTLDDALDAPAKRTRTNKPYDVKLVGGKGVAYQNVDLAACKAWVKTNCKPGEKYEIGKTVCTIGIEQVTKTRMVEI